MIHLVFGNLIIGIVEGSLLNRFFKSSLSRSIGIMILANYVSWIAGTTLIALFQNFIIDLVFDLRFVFHAWIISLVLLFILTVMIEFLFIYWIFKKTISLKKSIKYSLILNVVTYTLMITIYLISSGYNLFTEIKIDQSIANDRVEKHIFYALDKKDNVVSTYTLNDKKPNQIISFDESIEYPYQRLEPNLNNSNVSLVVDLRNDTNLIVDSSFCTKSDSIYYSRLNRNYSFPAKSDFRHMNDRKWTASSGDWAIQGLGIYYDTVNKRYAFEVPWMAWNIRDVSIINDHELVFCINGRVVLFDIDKMKMAFLFRADEIYLKRID